MTQKIKENVVIINKKDEFEYLPQANLATATRIASSNHLNL